MSDAMNMALQLSAVDMLSGIGKTARGNINRLGAIGKQARKDFESMSRGLKAVAIRAYDLKNALSGVEMNLAGSIEPGAIKRETE
ncbi:MAG: hypothetical protein GXP11_02010 [Gammaproteobacteria bacterium]|nr:hypothetical protein [Gammaproteobacteria bacterium]